MWLQEVENLLAVRPPRRLADDAGLTRSAVLVPLYVAPAGLTVVLIGRSDGVGRHAGQISFPGGVRCGEGETAAATALRESHEELGIEPSRVIVLGHLDEQRTSTGFVISPVVGAIPAAAGLKPSPREVKMVLRVTVGALAAALEVGDEELDGGTVEPAFRFGESRVWGATARILVDLLERLSGRPAAAARQLPSP